MEFYYSQHQHKMFFTVNGEQYELTLEQSKGLFKNFFKEYNNFRREEFYRTGNIEGEDYEGYDPGLREEDTRFRKSYTPRHQNQKRRYESNVR